MFEWTLSVVCNGLKTSFLKLYAKFRSKSFPDMPLQGSCMQFFDRTVGQNSVKKFNFDRNSRSKLRSNLKFWPKFWPISVKIFPNTCLATVPCLHNFDRKVGQNSVTTVILTESVGQNFGQIKFLTDFRSKFSVTDKFWPTVRRSKFRSKFCDRPVKMKFRRTFFRPTVFGQNFGQKYKFSQNFRFFRSKFRSKLISDFVVYFWYGVTCEHKGKILFCKTND